MGETLRDQVLPAVGRGLADNMAPAVSQITEAAAMGATRGLQRGLREDIAPAAIELRDAVIHGPRSTTHAIWALFALVVVLLAGITTIAGMAWRYFRRVMRRARSGTGSRRRSITALKIRRVTRRHGTATT